MATDRIPVVTRRGDADHAVGALRSRSPFLAALRRIGQSEPRAVLLDWCLHESPPSDSPRITLTQPFTAKVERVYVSSASGSRALRCL
jgi:hypothetical protein